MKSLIILCHPERHSFNGQLADHAADVLSTYGEVRMSDLYRAEFDPAEGPSHYVPRVDDLCFSPLEEQRAAYQNNTLPNDVRREIEQLEWADFVLLQFPIWWHSVPAMLKGWFDRVLVSGGLYSSRMRYGSGYFKGKNAMCSATLGAPEEVCVSGGRGGDISAMLWATHYSLHYMGYQVLSPHVGYGIQGGGYRYSEDTNFEQHLTDLRSDFGERLNGIEHSTMLRFPDWTDWDDQGRPRSSAPDPGHRHL